MDAEWKSFENILEKVSLPCVAECTETFGSGQPAHEADIAALKPHSEFPAPV